jgi:hypothetical protein
LETVHWDSNLRQRILISVSSDGNLSWLPTSILGLVSVGLELGFATGCGVNDKKYGGNQTKGQDGARQNRAGWELFDQRCDEDGADLVGRRWHSTARFAANHHPIKELTHCMAAFMPVRIPIFLYLWSPNRSLARVMKAPLKYSRANL